MKKLRLILAASLFGMTPVLAASSHDPLLTTGNPTFDIPATSTGTDPGLVSKGTDSPVTPATNVKGTVNSVESTSNQLRIVDDQGNSANITTGSNATIQKAGRTVSFADVSPGDRITVITSSAAGK